MRYIVLYIFFFLTVYSFSLENDKGFYFGVEHNVKPTLEIGFELSELLQNSFSNIGINNFTFLFG